ncbi:hypothetical protein PLESTB_000100000 [Pleodorina starrii]|uniref:glutathione-specific gamma-glutamylcyclotransferase n=1 Tax=Pleodorina starrii TaxID=330485 RepID=A0A9W6BB89_9CHLO|nr:hypothetical protein PLESTM_000096500 [Pleodorina starrii]GLC48457.1 hypothetical protein PLESTB_000100000 [Pleodorina starrii]GLC71777.1 hypothetical protein PLESTF_001165800 [Pleodorina starrii]
MSIWIFGYGSLIHTPNFQYDQRVVGSIKGYRRVFWQGSTDHRGTPERPGRTVTLTADDHPTAATWGVAFQLAGTPEQQAATLSYLEWREKQYDVRQRVDVYGSDGEVAVRGALVYIASPANGNYLGPADPRVIAAQIATCRGPSGPNCEYLFKLADAMRGMGVPDPELFELEEMVRQELTRFSRALGAAELRVTEVELQTATAAEAQGSACALGSCTAPVDVGEDGMAEAGEACGHEHFRRLHVMGGLAPRGLLQPAEAQQGVVTATAGKWTGYPEVCQVKGPTADASVASSSARGSYSMDAVCGSAGAASEPG